MRKSLILLAAIVSPALAQTPAGTINSPIYATGYISQVGGTNVTTNIPPQPNHPTNLNIYTTGAISGTWTIKLPNPAFEGQMLSFNCGAAANAISVTSSDGSSIDSTLPTACLINSGFTIQFDQRSNIWRNIGSNNTSTFKPFTGVTSQWPWQLNADGTWTLKQPTAADITYNNGAAGAATILQSQRNGVRILVTDFANVDRTGATDSTTGIANALTFSATTAAANGSSYVYLPCGSYLVSSTLTLSTSNTGLIGEAAGCVRLLRHSDYGPTVKVSNASSRISNIVAENIWSIDQNSAGGAAGYMSCATSPYHFVFDGLSGVVGKSLWAFGGCGFASIEGVAGGWFDNPYYQNVRIPGQSGETGAGTGVYVGTSANVNITPAWGSNLFIKGLEMEGGASYSLIKLGTGLRVDGVDGLWVSDSHIQPTAVADVDIRHSGTSTQGNIYFKNVMLDITSGNGLQMTGTKQVSRFAFEGHISAASAYSTVAANGVLITGTGGLLNGTFDIGVDGFGAHGFYVDASNVSNLVIRPKTFSNNGTQTSNTYSDLALISPQNYTISGGIIASTATAYGFNIGLYANVGTITGTIFQGNIGRAGVIATGPTKFTIVGNTCYGNTGGGILDNSGAVPKTIASNTGC